MRLAAIIPVRNMAATVGRAIDSALAAGCDDVVAVDDCSGDETPEVLAGYGDRITVWRWPRKPTEWVAALRVVWDATPADHYTWLGADDWLTPAFGEMVRGHADAAVVFSDYLCVDVSGRPIGVVGQEVTEPVMLTAEQMRARVQSDRNATETGIGSSIRGDVAKWLWASGFESMRMHSDSIGYTTAACMFGCALVPGIGAAFTVNPASYSQNQNVTADELTRRGVACIEWMHRVGLDVATTRALARKRCGATW